MADIQGIEPQPLSGLQSYPVFLPSGHLHFQSRPFPARLSGGNSLCFELFSCYFCVFPDDLTLVFILPDQKPLTVTPFL